jgi:hypothetical protein
MTDNQIILSGWKEICQACGIKSKTTMKRKAKKHHIPIKTLDGKPTIVKDDLIKWYSELVSDDSILKEGFIYFIQNGESGPIKIGFTTNIPIRISILQNSTPFQLRLLNSIEGTILDEQKMQKRFEKYRIKNEWFSPGKELIDFIISISNKP